MISKTFPLDSTFNSTIATFDASFLSASQAASKALPAALVFSITTNQTALEPELGFLDLCNLDPKRAESAIGELASNAAWKGKPEDEEWALLRQLEKNCPRNLTEPLRAWFSFLEEFDVVQSKISKDLRSLTNEKSFERVEKLIEHAASLGALVETCEKSPYPQTVFASLQKIVDELKRIRSSHSSFAADHLERAKQKWQQAKGHLLEASNDEEKLAAQQAFKVLELEQQDTLAAFEKLKALCPIQSKEKSTWLELLQSAVSPFVERISEYWSFLEEPDLKKLIDKEKNEALKTLSSIAEDCQAAIVETGTLSTSDEAFRAEDCSQPQDPPEAALLRDALQMQKREAEKLSMLDELADSFKKIESLLEKRDFNSAQIDLHHVCGKTWDRRAEASGNGRLSEILAATSQPIDDSLLEHVLGGHFGKGSGLEGYSSPKMLSYVADSIVSRAAWLKKFADEASNSDCSQIGEESAATSMKKTLKEQEVFEKLSQQFQKAQEIWEVFSESDFSKFVEKVAQEMKGLRKGESFFFHGGWVNHPNGHAVVYEITKEGGGRFSFRVYNRGDGLEYHKSARFEGKDFSFPFVEIVEVPFENLIKKAALKVLFELQKQPPANQKWDAKHLYQTFLPALGGKISSLTYTNDQYLETLMVGNCSYLSLTAWLSQQTQSSRLFRQWEFEIQLKTLWNYFQQKKAKGESLAAHSLLLFRKSFEQLARNGKETFENGAISLQEWSFANDRLQEIQKFLDARETEYKTLMAKNAKPHFYSQDVLPTAWPKKKITVPSQLEGLSEGKAFESQALDQFKFKSATLVSDITKIHRQCRSAMGGSDFPASHAVFRIKAGIEKVVENIPLSEIKSLKAKGGMNASQGKEAIAQLAELAKDYLWASMNAVYMERDWHDRTQLKDYVTAVKLLTLADAISRQFPETCVNLPDLFQKGMDFQALEEMPDPNLMKEIQEIRAYWKEKGKSKGGLSFFGFEKFAAGTVPMSGDASARWAFEDPSNSYGWDAGIDWKDINWVQDQIATNKFQIREKIKSYYPKLSKEPTVVQALACYSGQLEDGRFGKPLHGIRFQDLLPPTFFDFRDLSFTVDYILRNPSIAPVSGQARGEGIQPETYLVHNRIHRLNPLIPFGVKSVHGDKNLLNAKRRLGKEHDALPADFVPFYRQSKVPPKSFESDKKQTEFEEEQYIKTRNRIEPHHRVHKEGHGSFSLQEARELYALSSLPSHQIVDTFFYFRENPHLFSETGHRILFKKLMFEAPLLTDQLTGPNGKKLSEEISSFCTTYFNANLQQKNIPMAAYFLELSRLFQRAFKSVNVKGNFPEPKAEISKLLKRTDLTLRDKTFLRLEWLQNFAGEFDEDLETADLLASAIWVGKFSHDSKDPFVSGEKERAVRGLPFRLQAQILDKLQGDQKDSILNRVASDLLGSAITTKWTQKSGRFIDQGQRFEIDPIRARFYDKNDAKPLPISHRIKEQDPGILKTFGMKGDILARETSFGHFSCANSRGEAFEFIEHASGLSVFRQINGKWSELLPEAPESFPQALKEHHFWIQKDRVGDSYSAVIWISDPASGMVIAEAEGAVLKEMEKDPATSVMTTVINYLPNAVYKLGADQKRVNPELRLGSAEGSDLIALTSFENPSYILVWGSSPKTEKLKNGDFKTIPGRLTEISLPRFGLDFQVGTSARALCSQLENYWISYEQHVPSLGDLTNYLVLDHADKGRKMVLFPRVPLQQLTEGSFVTRTLPEHPGKLEPIPYVSFRLTEKGGIEPIGDKGDEPRLYLSMMKLWKHEYDAAMKFLIGEGSQIRRFTKGEKEILHWIFDLGEKNQDTDPKALAIRLKAGMALYMNEIDFGKDAEDASGSLSRSKLATLYQKTLYKLEQIPNRFRLTEEEKTILNGSDSSESIVENIQGANSDSRMYYGELLRSTETGEFPLLYAVGLAKQFKDQFYAWAKKPTYRSYAKLYIAITKVNHLPASISAENLFKLLRSDTPPAGLSNLYQLVIGSSLPKGTTDDKNEEAIKVQLLKEELLSALKMIRTGRSSNADRTAAAILEAVIRNPDAFPDEKRFNELLQGYESDPMEGAKKFEEAFDKSVSNARLDWQKTFKRTADQDLCRGIIDREKRCALMESPAEKVQWPTVSSSYGRADIPAPTTSDIPRLEGKLVVKGAVTSELKKKTENAAKELKGLFSGNNLDKTLKNQMEKLNQKIDAYLALPAATRPPFSLFATNQYAVEIRWQSVISECVRQVEFLTAQTTEVSNKLLKLINKQPEYAEGELHRSGHLSGDDQAFDIEAILYLYAFKDMDAFYAMNPSLSKEEMLEAFSLAQEYLIHATGLQHVKRLGREAVLIGETIKDILSIESQYRHIEKLEPEYNLKVAEFQKEHDDYQKIVTDYDQKVQEIQARYSITKLWNSDESLIAAYLKEKGLPIDFNPDVYRDLFCKKRSQYLQDKKLPQSFNPKASKDLLEPRLRAFRRDLDRLFELENSQRAYKIEEHPEYLLFEYFTAILLWKSQVENLNKLADRKSAILEMVMAGGKSSVLLPLLALKQAEGQQMALMVMPDELVAETSKVLRGKLKGSFDHRIDVLDIKRNETRLDHLERIEARLLQAQKDKKGILMSGSSLQTLFLSAIEKFYYFSNSQENLDASGLRKELEVASRILTLLLKEGNLTLDEVDMLFDVLKTHYFTVGEPKSMHEILLDGITDFYRMILKDPKFSTIGWDFVPSSKGDPFIQMDVALKKKIIEQIVEKKDIPDLAFLAGLDKPSKERVFSYLSEGDLNLDSLPKIQSDPKVKNLLAILKEEINKIFPLTAKKQIDEHYGSIPGKAQTTGNSPYMAIPYHGSNSPSIGCEFGSDLEIINYTIQLHLFKPIPDAAIATKYKELKVRIDRDLKTKKLEEIEAYKEFLKWGGKAESLSDQALAIRQIQASLEKDLDRKLTFIREVILAELKTYKGQIKTNGHIYPLLAKNTQGFSGTLWNSDSYPVEFQNNLIFSDTEPRTLMRLWEDSSHAVRTLTGVPAKDGIAQVFGPLFDEEIRSSQKGISVLDRGGIFRGMDNLAVAKELLTLASKDVVENLPNGQKKVIPAKIKGVIYFDQDELMVLRTGQKEPALLSSVPEEERSEMIAFWDQKHTTGSDIKGLDPKMKAVLTFSRYTMLRDLMQAAWRLRGLEKGQRVFFAVPVEEKKIIAKKLGLKESSELSLGDLYRYAKIVEASRQGDDNFRALHQKMESVLIKPALEVFFNVDLSWAWKKKNLYKLIKPLFVTEKSDDLFALYGGKNENLPAEKAAQDLADDFKKIIHELPKELKEIIKPNSLKRQLDEMAKDTKFLPETVSKLASYGMEVEVQTEKDIEVNKHIKTQNPGKSFPRPIVLWPFGEISKNYFRTIPISSWKTSSLNKASVTNEQLDSSELAKLNGIMSPESLKEKTGTAPFVSVNDVMRKYEVMGKNGEGCIFDASLWTTMNYMPVYPYLKSNAFTPFQEIQDASKRALVVKEKNSNKLVYTILNDWDAVQWENYLASQDNPNLSSEIGLFHWDLGFYRGADSSKSNAETQKLFDRLNVQAKFLSGQIQYTDKEITILDSWAKEKGKDNLRHFFNEKVLDKKTNTKALYPGSALWRFLEKKSS